MTDPSPPQERESAHPLRHSDALDVTDDRCRALLSHYEFSSHPADSMIASLAEEVLRLRAAPSAPTREQVEALRDGVPVAVDAWDQGYNAAIDAVLALYGESAKQEP